MPAPEALQKLRFEICQSCPELTSFNRCQKCGCFMVVKTRLKGAHCPLDKWPKLEQWIETNSSKDYQS